MPPIVILDSLIKDSRGISVFTEDVITYEDLEHARLSVRGAVRKNLIHVFEVIAEDQQSGNNLDRITKIIKQ